MIEVLQLAADLRARGEAFVIATIVRAEKPTSAKPGDKAVITADGVLAGWVGGSCAQPVVLEAAQGALADGECRLIQLAPDNPDTPAGQPPPSRNGLQLKPMHCYSGGTLEIYIEPYLTKPHLLVFGNSPVAQALVELGAVLHYQVTLVDLTDRPPLEGDARLVRDLDDIPPTPAESTFAIVATHGMFDERALEWLAVARPAYVGLVTSARRFEATRASLVRKGLDEAALASIRAPAGLRIGAKAPEEIALSILAEIVEARCAAVGAGASETAAACTHGDAAHGAGRPGWRES